MHIRSSGCFGGPADYFHSPFPFERLPPELRNEIYKLISVSQDTFCFKHLDHRLRGHTEGISLYNDFLNVQLQSAIFRVSKQTRGEGLALFYQHHHFLLSVEHGGCFLAITKWLRNIGSFWRSNIRSLEIRYRTRSTVLDASVIGRIGRYLSDKATVSYSAEGLFLIRSLWKTRQYLWSRDPSTAPSFNTIRLGQGEVIHESLDMLSNRPNWQSYATSYWLEASMTFHPSAS